jgi:chromosome segregation ATPase
LTLNETILMSNERAKRAEEESKELNSTVDFLKKEILDWEQKERAFNEQVKDKNDKIYELTKKIQNNEGQFFILQEKMKQLESNSEERKSSDEKSLRER